MSVMDPTVQSIWDVMNDASCSRSINLLQLASFFSKNRRQGEGLAMIMDGEAALDRLYGGYYQDWSCGGQWRNMIEFLGTLTSTLRSVDVHLSVYFNGALELDRLQDWVEEQMEMKERVSKVFSHLYRRATPPPKVWWVPPCGLRTMLRLALRIFGVPVFNTREEHLHEIMQFYWNKGYHGIMGNHPDFVFFGPHKLFSAHSIKLSFKFSITIQEFLVNDLRKSSQLDPFRTYLLGTLLGNHILAASDLQDFYDRILKPTHNSLFSAIVEFLRSITDPKDLNSIAKQVFQSQDDSRIDKFKQSVQYYVRGGAGGRHGQRMDKFTSKVASKVVRTLDIPHQVKCVASERHFWGQMSPLLYQILYHGEIKLPVLMENYQSSFEEVPRIHEFYRPLRQSVYAILFNLHHHKFSRQQNQESAKDMRKKAEELMKSCQEKNDAKSEEEKREMKEKAETLLKQAKEMSSSKNPSSSNPEVRIREWCPYNDYIEPDVVEGIELNWPVPSVQRLWFGTAPDDKEKRMKAFMTCMRCDQVKPMLLRSYIPEPLLLMCCVLRYIMNSPHPILKKQELDAFLVTAFSPELSDPRYLSTLRLDMVSPRGVLLSTLFMQGVEMALMANDACGAPIPFPMTLPWTFFDGKLFQVKLQEAQKAVNLLHLCHGRLDIMAKVESMRNTILYGLVNETQKRPPIGRGGKLIVGGAVVGQWRANYGATMNGKSKMKDRKLIKPIKTKRMLEATERQPI